MCIIFSIYQIKHYCLRELNDLPFKLNVQQETNMWWMLSDHMFFMTSSSCFTTSISAKYIKEISTSLIIKRGILGKMRFSRPHRAARRSLTNPKFPFFLELHLLMYISGRQEKKRRTTLSSCKICNESEKHIIRCPAAHYFRQKWYGCWVLCNSFKKPYLNIIIVKWSHLLAVLTFR